MKQRKNQQKFTVTCSNGHETASGTFRAKSTLDAILHMMGIYPGANEFKAELVGGTK